MGSIAIKSPARRQRQTLFDYLACDRVAVAWAAKKKARSADLDRLQEAVETYTDDGGR